MKKNNRNTKSNKVYKILGLILMPTIFITILVLFLIDSFTDKINLFNTTPAIGIALCVGIFIGLIIVIWYPVKILIQWNKKRKLTNKNLKLDIAIKEKQLEETPKETGAKNE